MGPAASQIVRHIPSKYCTTISPNLEAQFPPPMDLDSSYPSNSHYKTRVPRLHIKSCSAPSLSFIPRALPQVFSNIFSKGFRTLPTHLSYWFTSLTNSNGPLPFLTHS